MMARTKKELAQAEQERNIAFRQGIGAFIAGTDRSANPYKGHQDRAHQEASWKRGWESEQSVRSMNARLKEIQ